MHAQTTFLASAKNEGLRETSTQVAAHLKDACMTSD